MPLYEPQPSYLMYAFGGGWQVMGYVWDNIFKRTASAADWWYKQGEGFKLKADYASGATTKYWYYSAYAGCGLAGLCQYLAAVAIVSFYCVVQFCLLIVWAGINSGLIGFLACLNFLYGSYYKIFFRCPDCHEQMSIPIYVCPVCSTEHTRLWPSVYGVFYHRCSKCNTKLPTLDGMGRESLVQKCAVCKRPMNKQIGRLINVHVPVIGGPSTGKSNYIFMATNQLIDQYARPRGIQVTFPDENHKREYDNNLSLLSSGRELLKTPNVVPQAYNLTLKKPSDTIGRILYVYDAAGEAYADENNTLLQTYYKYVHGLIFVVDPFSIESFRRQHESEVSALAKSIRPSSLGVMDAYGRMLTMLESCVGIKKGQKFNLPIAIVISKTDALGLDGQIGHPAICELMHRNPAIRLEAEAGRRLIRQFLQDNELGNLIRDLELHFEHVGYFACSALGRMPGSGDARPYTPIGVLDPLLWVLGQADVINLRSELVHRMDQDAMTWAKKIGKMMDSAKFYYWDSLKPAR